MPSTTTQHDVRNVFVSSTSQGMDEYRQAASRALRSTGQLAVEMEDFTATPRPPAEVCQQKVRECDALVLILGFNRDHGQNLLHKLLLEGRLEVKPRPDIQYAIWHPVERHRPPLSVA